MTFHLTSAAYDGFAGSSALFPGTTALLPTRAVEAVELLALVLRLICARLPPLRANQPTCSSDWGSRDTASLREHTTRPDSLSTFHPGFRAVPASPKRRQARFQKVPLGS